MTRSLRDERDPCAGAERTSNGIFSSTSFDPVNCGAPTRKPDCRRSAKRPIIQQHQDKGRVMTIAWPSIPQQTGLRPRDIAANLASGRTTHMQRSQDEEQRAQDVLPLRDPRDDSTLSGCTANRAAPAGSAHALCNQAAAETKARIERVNQQAVKMMARRIQPKQLIVERMRQPCQRMPIRRVGGREGPLDGAPGGVTLDVAVRGDVFLIVQDDERVPNNWAVECDGPRASKMQRMTTRFLP